VTSTPEDTSFIKGPFSQEAYDHAFEYDVVDDDPLQAELTEKRLVPEMGMIVDGVRRIREIVDKRFLATMKQSGPSAAYGVLSHRDYPVGFCGIIRDTIFDVLDRSPMFTALQQEGVLLKKIYVILEGQYLQNAIQLGELYLDVANDSVDPRKEKIVLRHLRDVQYTCFDDYDDCFRVAESYLNIRLYPNLLFPQIAPILPMFAIAEDGKIGLFREHMVIAFKSIVRNHQPVKTFFLTSKYMQRTLPREYLPLIKNNCVGGSERMCVEFKEAGTTKSAVDFIEAQLERQGHLQDRADGILFSLAMKAYEQFNRMGIRPNSKSVAALRANGAIPTIRPKHW
jgi:hypothetical protein